MAFVHLFVSLGVIQANHAACGIRNVPSGSAHCECIVMRCTDSYYALKLDLRACFDCARTADMRHSPHLAVGHDSCGWLPTPLNCYTSAGQTLIADKDSI